MSAPELTLPTSGITWHEGYGGRDNDVRLTALMSYAWMCCG
jgi:hypothetical protein